ncbi:MAG TPA: SIR2 family protein [Longimicrobium sp.]|nr:SIR2 family protein [Longimicrobium sp.]
MPAIAEDLRQSLREGRVVPFVGAGVSRPVVDRATGAPMFQTWPGLLRRAAERLERGPRRAAAETLRARLAAPRPDYPEIAREARRALGLEWYAFLKEEIDPDLDRADPESFALARAVWGLGSRLVVTTNFDRVLHRACPEPLRSDLRAWHIQARVEQGRLLRHGPAHPTLWYLHGCIDDAEHLILTPDGYGALYPPGEALEVRYAAALTTLQFLLASHTFVFVGFSLDDPYFQAQLQRIGQVYRGVSAHYALLHRDEADRVEALELPVQVVPFDAFEALPALLDELGAAAAEGAERKRAVERFRGVYAQTDPAVGEAVLELVERLAEEGSDPAAIVAQLRAIRESDTAGSLASVSARAAGMLEDDLHRRRDEAEATGREYTAALEELRRTHGDVDERRSSIAALVRDRLQGMRGEAMKSFGTVLDRVPDGLRKHLASVDLADGSRLNRFRPRYLSHKAASEAEQYVEAEVARWTLECEATVLRPGLDALGKEIDASIHALGVDRLSSLVRVPELGTAVGRLDDRIHGELVELLSSALTLAGMKMAVSLFLLFPNLLFLMVGAYTVRDRLTLQGVTKHLAVQAVGNRIAEARTDTLERLDRALAGEIEEVAESIEAESGLILDAIAATLGESARSVIDSREVATRDRARVNEMIRRVSALRVFLDSAPQLPSS